MTTHLTLARQYLTELAGYSAEEHDAISSFARWLDERESTLPQVVPDSILEQAFALPGQ